MTIEQILKECNEVMKVKSVDYTTHSRHENFERMTEVMSWFKSEKDKPFVGFIACKIARLASLLDRHEPNNESINDSFKDLINYCILWANYRTEINTQNVDFYPNLGNASMASPNQSHELNRGL